MLKLSIITINLNNADGLRKTIDSVINQTYTHFEHIIIDGGSTDGSVEVIKEYEALYKEKQRHLYWVSEPDKGIYNGMNKGINKANGNYLVFINSGDYYLNNNCFEHFCSLNPIEDLLVADDFVEDENGNRKLHTHPDKINIEFLLSGAFSHAGSFFHNKFFAKERYDESYKIAADYLLYLKLFMQKECKYKRITTPYTVFTTGGISGDESMCEIRNQERLRAQKEVIPSFILEPVLQLIEFKKRTEPFINSNLIQLAIKVRSFYIKLIS